jgi:hypothetical protein
LLEVLRVIREEEPPRPSTKGSGAEVLHSIASNRGTEPKALTRLLRSELDCIVMKALEKDRNRRYETANALAADIERYLTGGAVHAHPPSAAYRLRKLVRRNRGPFVAAVAVLIALLAGAAVSTWQVSERRREQAERRKEEENVAARAKQAVRSQLDRAEASLKDHRLSQVNGSLGQAKLLLADAGAPDLRKRVAASKKDLDMVQRLDDAFAWRWNLAKGQVCLFPDRAKEMLPIAFRQYGFAIENESVEAAVRMIRSSTIADALRLALEQWFFLEPTRPGLRATLDANDADPVRAEIRAAVFEGRRDRVLLLVDKADPYKIPPELATSLGMYLPAEQGLRVMKAAWRRQPDSFPLVITIAARLTELDVVQKGSAPEAVGWCRTAVAIRPESAFAHHCLGVALGEADDEDSRRAELREAMRLAPRFSRAASVLAFELSRNPAKREEAFAFYSLMVAAQPHSAGGHAGLCDYYVRSNSWTRAADECLSIYDSLNDPGYNANDSCFDDAVSIATLDSYRSIIAGLIAERRLSDALRFAEQMIRKSRQPFWECSGCASTLLIVGDGKRILTDADSALIRHKALDWLSQGVSCGEDRFAKRLSGPDLLRWTKQCLSNAKLSSVRDHKLLASLPKEERDSWLKLWAAMRSLHDRAAPAISGPR